MSSRKLLFLVVIIVLVGSFFAFDLGRFFSLDALKAQQAAIEAYRAANPWLAGGDRLLRPLRRGHRAVAARRGLMTLAGGAVFGLLWGTLIVSFASSLGATLAFLPRASCCATGSGSASARAWRPSTTASRKEGAFYLFTLRLVPVFPFFLINLLLGLTAMKAGTFYWVSQLGMLAGTLVYVNAGTQLAKIDSLAGIVSPALLGSFALLGVFPLIAKDRRSRRARRSMRAGRSRPASTATWW
jgi:uncharacterized membrane protein YdjX (TVP38/TMEM64 family)